MDEEKFDSHHQEKVDQLNQVIGAQIERIFKLEKEIEWFKQLAMNLSHRSNY